MTTVMLVDDHEIVRQGLQHLIDTMAGFQVTAMAGDAQSAIIAAARHQPDIIMLDLMMPGTSGASAIPDLCAAAPDAHIVVLTSTDDALLTFQAVEAGATSLLPKTLSGNELIDALERISKGEDIFHPILARQVVQAVSKNNQTLPHRMDALSLRERRVLREMSEGRSNARIAASLFISEKTVKSHLSNIFAKLGVNDRTEAVALAWRSGFMDNKELSSKKST